MQPAKYCAVCGGKFDCCNLHITEKGQPSSHVKMMVDFFAVGGLAKELWWPLDKKLENREFKSKIKKPRGVTVIHAAVCLFCYNNFFSIYLPIVFVCGYLDVFRFACCLRIDHLFQFRKQTYWPPLQPMWEHYGNTGCGVFKRGVQN